VTKLEISVDMMLVSDVNYLPRCSLYSMFSWTTVRTHVVKNHPWKLLSTFLMPSLVYTEVCILCSNLISNLHIIVTQSLLQQNWHSTSSPRHAWSPVNQELELEFVHAAASMETFKTKPLLKFASLYLESLLCMYRLSSVQAIHVFPLLSLISIFI